MRFSTFHSTITSMGIFLLIILELFWNIVFRMKDGTHLTSWKLSVEKWTNKSSEYRIRPKVHQKLTKYGHKLQILFAEGDTFLNASDYCRKSLGTKRCSPLIRILLFSNRNTLGFLRNFAVICSFITNIWRNRCFVQTLFSKLEK